LVILTLPTFQYIRRSPSSFLDRKDAGFRQRGQWIVSAACALMGTQA
jgi:hypothetical protein